MKFEIKNIWVVVIFLFIISCAYFDLVLFGVGSFSRYLLICTIEVSLVSSGFIIGKLTKFKKIKNE